MSDGEVGISNLTGPLKILLLLLTILAIVVPSVLGWVNFDKRIDIVEDTHEKHELSNKEKFVALDIIDKKHSNDITALEKREIARNGEFEMLRQDGRRMEVKLDLVIAELKRLERTE